MAPYTEEDLTGLKKYALADRIRRQIDCWPGGSFNESKTTMKQMKAALLNCANGFSTSDPFIEGSPLTSLSATPPAVSTATPSQPQPDAIGTAQLAQSDYYGNNLQKNAESSKELASVILFLEDRRFNPVKKSIIRLCVDVDHGEEENGEPQVSAREVIRQLQHSHSALNGPVKLGTPYHEDPSYIEYFVQFTNTNNLEDCSFSLESLSVVSSKLEIFAENVTELMAWKSLPVVGEASGHPETFKRILLQPSPRL